MKTMTLSIKQRQIIRRLLQVATSIGLIGTICLGFYLWYKVLLTDPSLLRQTIKNFGFWGPLAFIGVQMIQVIVPIIPGGITLAVGPLLFGPWFGFLYNYIGIVVGSIILFCIGRYFGTPIVETFVSRKIHHKYIDKLNSKGWVKTFTVLMAFPIAPDDALVLLTSVTKMRFKTFIWILLLSKPIGIACYSLLLLYGFEWLTQLI